MGTDTCSDGSYADACVTDTADPIGLESCWQCSTYGDPPPGGGRPPQPLKYPRYLATAPKSRDPKLHGYFGECG